MAKRVRVVDPVESAPAENERPNPDFLGVDLQRALVMAGGAGLSGYLNDMLVTPVLKPAVANAFPGEAYDSVITQLADALSTIAVAVGAGKLLAMVFGARVGSDITLGGAVLGGGRGLASLIPGYSLNYSFPSIPGISGLVGSLGPPPAAAPLQLASGAASTAGNVGRLGVGSTGL